MPSDTAGRAPVRTIAQAIACEMHPRLPNRVRTYVAEKLSEQAQINWYAHWARQGFNALENWLSSDPNTGRFCHGDTITMADCFLIPLLYAAKRYELDLSAFPTLLEVNAACTQHSVFLEALPENQSDAGQNLRP